MHPFKNNPKISLNLLLAGVFLLAACNAVTGGTEPVAEVVAPAAPTRTPEPASAESDIATSETDEAAGSSNESSEAEAETAAKAAEEISVADEVTLFDEAVEGQIVTDDGQVIFTVDDRNSNFAALTSSWNTNFERHTIQYDEILSGGPPRDGIPSIDEPTFVSQNDAAGWLAGNEPVIAVEIDGEARAYPIQILTWHEIVNDTLADVPILVTFCPLCNSAIVFERRVDGEAVEFGTSGLLRNSDLIMYDRQTESLWQQFTGDAIVGDQVPNRLTFLASSLISYDDFQAAYPDGVVLSQETGFSRSYGQNPYVGYDTIGSNPFLFTGEADGRLPAVERVVTVSLEDEGIDVAYPLSTLASAGAINDQQGSRNLAVFHSEGTASALGAQQIAEGEDVGATGVFDPVVEGQLLTFRRDGSTFIDAETGTTWNIVGQGLEGPLAGTQLEPVIHGDHFWFSWAAFRPDTIIYQ